MPSPLTRTVFRALVAGQPIAHHGCLRRQALSLTRPVSLAALHARHAAPVVRPPHRQRRGFFNLGLFRKAPRGARDADLAPGIALMEEYAKMERVQARLPPVEDVATACHAFFQAKNVARLAIEDSHAQLAHQSFKYVVAEEQARREQGAAEPLLKTGVIVMATATLGSKLTDRTSHAHRALAELLHAEMASRQAVGQAAASETVEAFKVLARVLCHTGNSAEARTKLFDVMRTPDPDGFTAKPMTVWSAIMYGFAREGNEVEMLETYRMACEHGYALSRASITAILSFYLDRDDVQSAKSWWSKYQTLNQGLIPDERSALQYANIVGQVLRSCLRTNELEWGKDIVRDIMQTSPPKPLWDVVLVWAVGTRKSVDEIDRMLGVMESSNESLPESEWRVPDIATVNALVECAISRNDPYMAERFITLGRHRGIEPDARTYALQIDYRLSVDDVDGALTAYKNLQAEDLSSNQDIPVVNKLIVALCTSKRHDFDTIMNVAADLSDRRARFTHETVAALCILHLSRDELHDVIDLLNTHAFHYSSAERASIRDTLIAYITSPSTSTTRAWDAYTIFRRIFDEAPRELRTHIMQDFLRRGRADMAVHVFNHMRTHTRADTIPTVETYVAALMGIAALADLESVEAVHNRLKLDYNVNPTTHLHNALILAYTAVGKPRRALDFWDDIVASREGPTYNSIHIALRACEKSPFGDLQAQQIWERLRRMGVELDQSMWASYVGGRAGNGDNEAVFAAIEEAEDKGELEVDHLLVGSFFNASPGQTKQAEIEAWARERYPQVWRELEAVGIEERDDGMRQVKIDRSLAP